MPQIRRGVKRFGRGLVLPRVAELRCGMHRVGIHVIRVPYSTTVMSTLIVNDHRHEGGCVGKELSK